MNLVEVKKMTKEKRVTLTNAAEKIANVCHMS